MKNSNLRVPSLRRRMMPGRAWSTSGISTVAVWWCNTTSLGVNRGRRLRPFRMRYVMRRCRAAPRLTPKKILQAPFGGCTCVSRDSPVSSITRFLPVTCTSSSTRPRVSYETRNTFITSSPRWLMTFTAKRPDRGFARARDVSLRRVAQAASLISALSVLLRAS